MNTTKATPLAPEYDYVVVGGGSAGCVLARRLSDTGSTVLLIEAGPADGGALVSDPARWVHTLGSELDWKYEYAPATATYDRRIGVPRGKVLGGSSAINATLWYRGHSSDYDRWEESGADGWNYDSLLPYFRRCEDWQDGADFYRGSGGPMRIENSADPHPIASALLSAAAELGMPVIADANGASNLGATLANLTKRGSVRCSAARGYLDPVSGRQNLDVVCESLAVGLNFEGDRCVGVSHFVAQELRVSRARVDVILALGALESPRLLMLSGIGDPVQLRPLGIELRVDLPGVGANLQDHPLLMGMNFYAKQPLGPVRDNGGGSMLNWCSDSSSDRPDLHAFVVQGRHAEPAVQDRYQMNDEVFAISPGLMRSRSVGSLRLTSAAPASPLIISPNFLGDPSDLAALCASIDTVMDLAATRSYKDLVLAPGSPDRRLTQSEKEDFVRTACSTFFHLAGTCAMGTGAQAVVDPQLRVYGTSGLRVVDASVIPVLPSCNTGAPVIAIAERAADLIRDAA